MGITIVCAFIMLVALLPSLLLMDIATELRRIAEALEERNDNE